MPPRLILTPDITPEMLAIGAKVLADNINSRYVTIPANEASKLAAKVYLAMYRESVWRNIE